MATAITNIFNQWHTFVQAYLTTYTELPEAYDLEENPDLYMTKAYAVRIGPGAFDPRETTCHKWVSRSFSIILVNKVTTTSLNTTQRKALQAALMEDQETLLYQIENDVTLNGTCIHALYDSDTGVEYLETERDKFLMLETEFNVSYQRTI